MLASDVASLRQNAASHIDMNETTWNSVAEVTTANPDCSIWRNDQEQLCYACSSYKGGIIAPHMDYLISLLVLGSFLLFVLSVTYWVAESRLKRIKRMEMQNVEKDTYGESPLFKVALPSV